MGCGITAPIGTLEAVLRQPGERGDNVLVIAFIVTFDMLRGRQYAMPPATGCLKAKTRAIPVRRMAAREDSGLSKAKVQMRSVGKAGTRDRQKVSEKGHPC